MALYQTLKTSHLAICVQLVTSLTIPGQQLYPDQLIVPNTVGFHLISSSSCLSHKNLLPLLPLVIFVAWSKWRGSGCSWVVVGGYWCWSPAAVMLLCGLRCMDRKPEKFAFKKEQLWDAHPGVLASLMG